MCALLEPIDPSFWSKVNRYTGKLFISAVLPLKDNSGQYHFEDSEISRIMTLTHITKQPADFDEFDLDLFNYVNKKAEVPSN